MFCDFYDGRGYTYVAKADLGQLDDFAELYTESDYVHLKIKYANGEQHVVSLEQLRAQEHSYPLSLHTRDTMGITHLRTKRLDHTSTSLPAD